MDFKRTVGRQVLWTGAFANDATGGVDNYMLFDDGSAIVVPDQDSDEKPRILEGLDALKTHLAEAMPIANNIMDLKAAIEKIEAPKEETKVDAEKNESHMVEAHENEVKHDQPVHA